MLWLQPNRCFTISHDWKPLTPQQHSIADRFHILPLCQIVTLSIFYQFTRQALTPQQHHIANRFCILPLRHASILYSCAWTKLQLPNSIPNPIDYIYSHYVRLSLYISQFRITQILFSKKHIHGQGLGVKWFQHAKRSMHEHEKTTLNLNKGDINLPGLEQLKQIIRLLFLRRKRIFKIV